MNILAIGNSFSDDATRYLHGIAHAAGETLTVVNLFIGGCPLERHYRNMLSGERAYQMRFNGQETGFSVSLDEALLSRAWDIVTMQQASPFSFRPDSYTPYIEALVEHVRKYAPKARLYLHETWAYEDGSDRLARMGFASEREMREAVVKTYHEVADRIGFDGFIPSGELFGKLREEGIPKLHRDGFHASMGLGRYALALLWYHILTGKDVTENTYCDFDMEISQEEISIAKKCVMKY